MSKHTCSDAQSAFVRGRQITDNVLVAFEIMHCINQRRKGKKGLMSIKLDMSKAYDRIEWVYLEAMMRKLGFQDRWISLMMMCVTTVSYSVLINGERSARSCQLEGLGKGTRYHCTFSYCVLRASRPCLERMKMGEFQKA